MLFSDEETLHKTKQAILSKERLMKPATQWPHQSQLPQHPPQPQKLLQTTHRREAYTRKRFSLHCQRSPLKYPREPKRNKTVPK